MDLEKIKYYKVTVINISCINMLKILTSFKV